MLSSRHRYLTYLLRAAEEVDERKRVQGSRHDDHAQMRGLARVESASNQAKEHISVDTPLVRLIEDDEAAAVEAMLARGLSDQHPVRHILQACRFGSSVVESYVVSDKTPHLAAHLGRHAEGHADGCDASGLRDCDHTLAGEASLVQELGYLRCLPTPGLTGEDQDPMALDGRQDLLPVIVDWKIQVTADSRVVAWRTRSLPVLLLCCHRGGHGT
mmetsp:Transcript_46891/g.101866  ORF Transcript_46891/g.101866 Transcript_46891/m.101866 type:complete len:215 (+) Transcript_46891:1480-2124(+)